MSTTETVRLAIKANLPEAGKMLAELRASSPHGSWQSILDDLGIDRMKASRLIKSVTNANVTNLSSKITPPQTAKPDPNDYSSLSTLPYKAWKRLKHEHLPFSVRKTLESKGLRHEPH